MKASTPFVILAMVLAVSCATAPLKTNAGATEASANTPDPAPNLISPSESSAKAPVPGWTVKTTYVDGPNLVFVLNGTDKTDVTALALQSMTSYLNLPLAATTPPETSEAVKKFLKKMSATVPSDRFVRDGRAWWKVVVGKADWDSSQARLASLFHVAPDPVADLEKAADEALLQGRYFEAVDKYVGAASAAVADGAPPQADRFQSNLTKAQAVLAQFTLTSSTPPQTTQAGKPFASPFNVKLTYGADAQAPVTGALLRFSYKTKVNGHAVMTGQSLTTDALGEASLTLPVPDFGAKDNVVVMIDVNPWLEALAKVPQSLRDPVMKFEPLMADRKALLPYTVESASKQVPMIVALADLDDKGSVERRQETTSALIAALKGAGFQASGLSVNLSLLKSTNENVVLTAWRFQGKTTGRAVYGTVSLVSVTAADSQFSAEVSGTAKVVDLATNQPVYQYKNSAVAAGSDKVSAVAQGFRQWANDAAASMADELP